MGRKGGQIPPFWELIRSQTLEDRLPHTAICRVLHKFYDTNQLRFNPDRIFITMRRYKKRGGDLWHFFNTLKIFPSDTESYMTFIDKLLMLILSQNNTYHIIVLKYISADYKIIVYQVFYFDPVLRSFTFYIKTVFSFGDNAFHVLLFGECVKCHTLALDVFG